MKIAITGSLGNTAKPLVLELVKKGHAVTVISSNAERTNEIESLGAVAAIGSLQDVEFLIETFKGNDAAYLMEPAGNNDLFVHGLDVIASKIAIGRNYKQAVEASGLKHIVHLSSIGAHMAEGNGLLAFHYHVENILGELPSDVSITFIRAGAFFENVFYNLQSIKLQDAIIANYDADIIQPWVAMEDIADAVAEELENPNQGRRIRYVVSDEVTSFELTRMLAKAIHKPAIEWRVISDQEMIANMIGYGMDPQSAKIFTELSAVRREGVVYKHYLEHKPAQLGKRKLKDFIAEVFVPAYDAFQS